MADTVKASQSGLELVYQAIRQKGWTKTQTPRWWEEAHTTQATLKRFWRPTRIDRYTFQEICRVAGVDWEQVVDNAAVTPPPATPSSPSPKLSLLIPSLDCTEIRWVGRGKMITQLIQGLQGDCRLLSIVGITGIGKTSLAQQVMDAPPLQEQFFQQLAISFYSQSPNFGLVACAVLGESVATQEKLQQDPDTLVQAMVGKLQSQPYLLILDMVEEVLEADGEGGQRFREPIFEQFLTQVLKTEAMPSRILITSQDQLPTLAEGRYSDRTHQEPLKGLTLAEGLELFEKWEIEIQEDNEQEFLKRIITAYEGHPLALRIIAGEIRDAPFFGNIQTYWSEYGQEIEAVEQMKNEPEQESRKDKPRLDRYSPQLKDLVKTRVDKTFQRLYDSYPLACLLLCKGAVARCATERAAWLFQIRQATLEEQNQAFETLQRRFLLEQERTRYKLLYRLHSLIRRVALEHLSKIEQDVVAL